jgi:protein-L-isoaspartate(D-aspartate) O-methyltransferase
MEALRQTPRDEFVPHELRYGAYANRPLPIGHGQTISQPYVVALMTGLIQPQPQPGFPRR